MAKLKKRLIASLPDDIRDYLDLRVLSVDPGPKASYYALFFGGDLVKTGKISHKDFDWSPGEQVDLALIEVPTGWPVKSKDGGISLLESAIRAGEWLGWYRRYGALSFAVPSAAWRAVLFGRPNPSDKDIKLYTNDLISNRDVQLNNVHVRDAIAMFLAIKVASKEVVVL